MRFSKRSWQLSLGNCRNRQANVTEVVATTPLYYCRNCLMMASASGSQAQKESKWLNAFSDNTAGLYTFSTCMSLTDLNGDGDYKLIVADLGTGSYNMRLKVYKGTAVVSENTLIDLPTAVCTFFMDAVEPRVPAIAVASGPCIYVYKNLKPYYKFTLANLEISPAERELWEHVKAGKVDSRSLTEFLESLRSQMSTGSLCTRSQRFLMLKDVDKDPFINAYKDEPLKRQTLITCLTVLNRNSADRDAINTLVFGSENGNVYVIDSEAFLVLSDTKIPAAPVLLSATGLFDVDYRIIVVCRNGCVYTLKRGVKSITKATIELNSQAVGMTKVQKQIFIGCMDGSLRCYSLKGKKLWSVTMPATILTVEPLDYGPKNFQAVIVALENKEVRIYRDVYLVDQFNTDAAVTALKFGCFGREEGALVAVLRGGDLLVKLLKRTAKFEDRAEIAGPPVAQAAKLNVPKKTKIFVDQTMRERDQAAKMHQTFQRDLFRLRLETAKAYVKTIETKMTPMASVGPDGGDLLRVSAQVNGFGPIFLLKIFLEATGSEPVTELSIGFQYNTRMYRLEKPLIPVSILIPGIQYSFESKVTCINDKGLSDDIKVLVSRENESTPIITALITMPVSEANMLS